MAYTKTTWNNDAPPAINATNLNKIEQGIYDNSQSIDSIVAASHQFDSGLGTISNISANSYKDLNVTFTTTFSAAPIVVATVMSSATTAPSILTVLNISTTGFTIRIFNTASATRSPAFRWIAIN